MDFLFLKTKKRKTKFNTNNKTKAFFSPRVPLLPINIKDLADVYIFTVVRIRKILVPVYAFNDDNGLQLPKKGIR